MTQTSPLCSCGKPVGDDAYLCSKCTTQLRDNLTLLAPAATEVPVSEQWARDFDRDGRQRRDVGGKLIPVNFGRGTTTRWDTPTGSKAGLLDHLDVTMARQGRSGESAPRGAEKPATTYHPAAAEIRGKLDQQLRPWATWLAGEQTPKATAAMWVGAVSHAPTSGVVSYLAMHVERIRHSESAPQLADAVENAVATIRKIIDRKAERVFVGVCGAERSTEDTCPIWLYADKGATQVVCSKPLVSKHGQHADAGCGTTWNVADRLDHLQTLLPDQLAPLSQIATGLTSLGTPVTVKRIQKWVERGRLVDHGTDPAGTRLYRVGDVQDRLADHEARYSRKAQ